MRRFEVFYDLQIPGSVKIDAEAWEEALDDFNNMGTIELVKGLDMDNPTRVDNEQITNQEGEVIDDSPSWLDRFHAVKAFTWGVIDGSGPFGPSIEIKWPETRDFDTAYDHGTNVGQALASMYTYLVRR